MIDSVPLIQNPNDAQQINASIIAMKKASRELDEKIGKLNSLNSELDKKIALLDSGLNKEIEDRKEAIKSLDVASVGGSGKYISAISETDGKISATASDITSTVSSGNSQPVTSGGVAETLNNPVIKTFSNNVASSKIIHLGHFTIPSSYTNRCGLNIEVEAKRVDGSYRILASIIGQNIKIGVFDAEGYYFNLYFYKTDDNNFDLYLYIGSYIGQVFVRMTEPQHFTYDGSVVTSYAGTRITPIYSNSIDSVTSGNHLPVTSGAVASALSDKMLCKYFNANTDRNVLQNRIDAIKANLVLSDYGQCIVIRYYGGYYYTCYVSPKSVSGIDGVIFEIYSKDGVINVFEWLGDNNVSLKRTI